MKKISHFMTCILTPEKAEDYLAHHMFHRQRPVSQSHVNYLATLMRLGHFRHGTILTFAYLKSSPDQAQCINGQHTLHAIVQSQVPQEVVVEYREVPTEAAIASLYASYDRGRMRSVADAIQAFPDTQEAGLQRSHLSLLGGAIPLIVCGFDGLENDIEFMALMRHAETRFQFMEPWIPEMRTVLTLTHGQTAGHIQRTLKRAAVLAVMLTTLRYQPDSATTFWRTLLEDDGLSKGDPGKTLLNFLYATPAVHLRPHIYARYVASAWNAAFTKQTVTKLYARDSTIPILLKGTPHKGEHTMRYFTTSGTPLTVPVRKP